MCVCVCAHARPSVYVCVFMIIDTFFDKNTYVKLQESFRFNQECINTFPKSLRKGYRNMKKGKNCLCSIAG